MLKKHSTATKITKRVIVDKIYLRKEPFYESNLTKSYLSFGDIVEQKTLIYNNGDFNYIAIETKAGYTGFVPEEYLINENKLSLKDYKDLNDNELKQIPLCFTNYKKIYINKIAYNQAISLLKAMHKDKIQISIIGGYKSIRDLALSFAFEYEEIFMQNVPAKPYYSYYHRGLILSLTTTKINNTKNHSFYKTKAYKWLEDNAHKYNFQVQAPLKEILRENPNNWKPWEIHFDKNIKQRQIKNKIQTAEKNTSTSKLFLLKNSLCLYKEKSNTNNSLKYILLHSNEQSAKQCLRYAINSYGGTAYSIINNNKRNIKLDIGKQKLYYDPNRIFIEESLKDSVLLLNENIKPYIINKALKIIIAISRKILFELDIRKTDFFISLHTNNRCSDFSLNYFKDKALSKSFETSTNKEHNPKNFFYTIHKDDFLFLRKEGYNVVLQKENVLCNDGSLSILMSKKHIDFITIEVQEGYLELQKEMLDLIIRYVNTKKLNTKT